jgi:hypothetical protein
MFGEILERISPMQAEFLLKVDNWKFPLNEKDNFQTQFINISKIDTTSAIQVFRWLPIRKMT